MFKKEKNIDGLPVYTQTLLKVAHMHLESFDRGVKWTGNYGHFVAHMCVCES